MHVFRPHLLIGFPFGNNCSTFVGTVNKGSDLGGLEFSRGRFGSFPTTLLLTSMYVCSLVFCFFFCYRRFVGEDFLEEFISTDSWPMYAQDISDRFYERTEFYRQY